MLYGYCFKSADEAFEYITQHPEKRAACLYSTSAEKTHEQICIFIEKVKKKNSAISIESDQILLSHPYIFNDMDGCLHVVCAEITYGKFDEIADKISLCTGWNYSVLRNPALRKPLCANALVVYPVSNKTLRRW